MIERVLLFPCRRAVIVQGTRRVAVKLAGSWPWCKRLLTFHLMPELLVGPMT
jgi:hypothetical protein